MATNLQAEAAQALGIAAQARLTLAGKVKYGGFWVMPSGRDFILLCWRNQMAIARWANEQARGRP